MPIHLLDNNLWFPPVTDADEDGLLAVGGDLSVNRLLLGYSMGIFPWFNEGEPPLWWSPDPRFVLFPEELRISKSMKKLIHSEHFEFRTNTPFATIISHCRNIPRPGQSGTWITPVVEQAYLRLHEAGFAHAASAWIDDRLAGGLYGVLLGKVFFGESMFSLVPNASKFAFIKWVEVLKSLGVTLIDCQVYTAHLQSLGARMIPRVRFLEYISRQSS